MKQSVASVLDPDLNPDPHSMGFWIRIHIANADPDQKGENQLKKRRKVCRPEKNEN
jgi:hypothetical protein